MWSRTKYYLARHREGSSRYRWRRHHPTRTDHHFGHRLPREPWQICRLHRCHLGYCQRRRTIVGWCKRNVSAHTINGSSFRRSSPITFLGDGVSSSTCAFFVSSSLIYSLTPARPTGGLAGILLFFFLNLNPHQGKGFREHVREFDFIGLGLMVVGVVCLLIGFNFSETTCA